MSDTNDNPYPVDGGTVTAGDGVDLDAFFAALDDAETAEATE